MRFACARMLAAVMARTHFNARVAAIPLPVNFLNCLYQPTHWFQGLHCLQRDTMSPKNQFPNDILILYHHDS
jgi:hypothetical protein